MSRRAAVRLLAVGLIAAGGLAYLRPREEAPRARLRADVGGPMTLAVGSVASARRSPLRNAETVTRIVNALPPRVRMLLLVNDPGAFTVARNPWPDRISFVVLPEETEITIWPQDPFLVLEDRLLAPREFERAGDRAMGEAVARALRWRYEVSELDFEGGNVLADERVVFIGADTIRKNALRLGEPDAAVARRFEAELGRPVVVVGPLPQPVGHVDMILTPLGAGRLALADPALGARLALAETPEAVEAFERACERGFFGHPSITTLPGPDGEEIRAPEMVGSTVAAAERCRTLAPVFDKLAEELAAHGYEVVRIPFLTGPPATPEGARGRAGYPWLTYNNVLIERDDGRDVVYLPQYGWPALDDAARHTWRGLGYTVRTVEGLTTSAMYGGSLRCNVKVLAR